MKKIAIIFVILSTVIFSEINPGSSGLSTLKTIKARVKEENYFINNDKVVSDYMLFLQLPDKIKKIQSFPEINKGEIYIYSNGIKTTYLPFFDQVSEEKVSLNEKNIINYLNEIVNLEKNNKKFREDYLTKEVVVIKKENGELIELKTITKIDNVYIPTEINVFKDKNQLINIKLEQVEINPILKKDEFKLENEKNKM